MERRQLLVVVVSGVLGAGAALAAGACGDDRGSVEVQGGTATGGGTSTTPVKVDTNAAGAGRLDSAMGAVEAYGRRQAAGLVGATEDLRKAIDANDVPAAKRAYADGRPFYERIEPLVALFPELDGKIDAREDDFPKKAADPAWTGFHPIERAVFRDQKISARTKQLAAGLVRDAKTLQTDLDRADVPPSVVIPGTAELVDEVEESKITGEEERYSKLDIPTFIANLEGSRAFWRTLEPIVEEQDPALGKQIDSAFAAAFEQVETLKQGGAYPPYDTLTAAQRRAVKQRIEALAEPLARVQGTLGVRS